MRHVVSLDSLSAYDIEPQEKIKDDEHWYHALISAYVVVQFDIGRYHTLYKDELKKQYIQDRLNEEVKAALDRIVEGMGYKRLNKDEAIDATTKTRARVDE